MALSSRQHHHARHCHGQDRRYDRGKAQARLCAAGHRRLASRLIQGCLAAALILFCAVGHVTADNISIATFNAELTRKGPGLLLRDILKEEDPQVAAFTALMRDIRPDIIALQGIDYDLEHRALTALTKVLEKVGLPYPYSFTAAPNAGQTSGLDLNGNGRLGNADDAHGFGRYTSMGGMAVLSRFEIMHDAVEDYTNLLWRNLDGHIFPFVEGRPFGGEDAFAAHRLSSRNHWVIPILTPNGASLRLMTFHATPPSMTGMRIAMDAATMTRLPFGMITSRRILAQTLSFCLAQPTLIPSAAVAGVARSRRFWGRKLCKTRLATPPLPSSPIRCQTVCR